MILVKKTTIEFRVANESLAAQIQIFVTSYSRKKIRGQGVRLPTVILLSANKV